MKRLAYYDLLKWASARNRKPVILFGARQVGKTHLARAIGETLPNFVEVNLEKIPAACQIFQGDLDPEKMIRQLELITKQDIVAGKTLLFLDEIQEQPRAVTALRYFYEEMPDLHVIAAGSLLDFAIEKIGVPVGRVTFRWLYPLSFIEFLAALGHKKLAKAIIEQKFYEALPEVIHNQALSLVGEYIAIGGMPKAVDIWRTQKDIKETQTVHQDITAAYQKDFPKYAKKHQIKYVEILFRQLPRYICKPFKYKLIDSAYQKRELEPALDLLKKARIIHQINYSHATSIPLGAEVDLKKHKLILLDVALTQSILGLDLSDWFLEPKAQLSNKSEITEAFVGQELLAYNPPNQEMNLYYWQSTKPGAQAELDYVYPISQKIIPIEVKSGHGAQLQSLRLFLEKRDQTPYGIRFSVYNYSYIDQLQNLPLYAVACIIEDKTLFNCLLDAEHK